MQNLDLKRNNLFETIDFVAVMCVLAYPLLRFVFCFFTSFDALVFNICYLLIFSFYLLPKLIICKLNSKKSISSKTNILERPEILIFIIFLVWLFISCFFAQSKSIAFFGVDGNGSMFEEGYIQFLAYALMFYFAFSINNENKKFFIIKSICIISAIVAILCFIDPNGHIFPAFFNTYPHSAMFINSNHYGYYLSMVILLSLGMCFFEKQLWQKILFGALCVTLSIQLLLNGSLGPEIAVCAALLLFPFAYRIFKQKWNAFTFIPPATFLIFAAFINHGQFYSDFAKTIVQLFSVGNAPSEELETFGTGRMALWIHSFELIKNYPLFGIGLGNFTINGAVDRPHNEYLQYAVNGGIIASLLYISALCIMFVRVFKNKNNT